MMRPLTDRSTRRVAMTVLTVVLAALVTACAAEAPDEPGCTSASGCAHVFVGTGLPGLGADGHAPTETRLYLPMDLNFGVDGAAWVIDWNNHRIRIVRDGKVETLIGTGDLGDAPDGQALDASLNHPTHISFHPGGEFAYVAAWHNSKVLRYDLHKGTVETICGNGKRSYGGDGGPAKDAVLDLPVMTALDGKARMVILDQANQRVRRIEADGTIHTIAGPQPDAVPDGYSKVCSTQGDGTEWCRLCSDAALAEVGEAECVSKPQGFRGDGGPATEALFNLDWSQSTPPRGSIAITGDGRMYIVDTNNHRVRRVDAAGIIHTVAGSGPAEWDPTFGGGYAGDGGPATEALLREPRDVAVAGDGSFYIADTWNDCVRKVDTNGTISAWVGVCGQRGKSEKGTDRTAFLLNRPYGVALDPAGVLYVADTHNHRVIRVEP